MSPRRKDTQLLLKGTRTAMSFVAEARRLAAAQPYPAAGQPEYSAMADMLARAVLFANWEVVGAAALVRAGSVTRVVEMGLTGPFRSDEFMRRLTWRLLADAAHELVDTPEIEDAYQRPLDICAFITRRRRQRAEDNAAQPTPIGRIEIPRDPAAQRRRRGPLLAPGLEGIPHAPRGLLL